MYRMIAEAIAVLRKWLKIVKCHYIEPSSLVLATTSALLMLGMGQEPPVPQRVPISNEKDAYYYETMRR